MRDGATLTVSLPAEVAAVLGALASAGHEAALVGGSVRDLVRGEEPSDWDVATAAPPEVVAGMFPGATWQNRFGTVTVQPKRGGAGGGAAVEVTTFRVEGAYRDRRRPDEVRWGTSLRDDLARRDFTINAMAWAPSDLAAGIGRLVDPFGGALDLADRRLRTVGDPDARLDEDALRVVRAVRFATRFDLAIDPPTEDAVRRAAPSVRDLSGERVRDELLRILAGEAPSRAFQMMERLGLLDVLLPELNALRGVPQAKALGGDALDHSLRTADALPDADPVLRMAGLLHDLGKATTLADGHFIGHEVEGATIADSVLRRLRVPRVDARRIVRLVRHHMFGYAPEWTDAAVRRFVRRVSPGLLEDLFALRAADNVASGGREEADAELAELRRRAEAVIAADPLTAGQLAVRGNDLMLALQLQPGPRIGRLLARLLEVVIEEPRLNRRDTLLDLARRWLEEEPAGD